MRSPFVTTGKVRYHLSSDNMRLPEVSQPSVFSREFLHFSQGHKCPIPIVIPYPEIRDDKIFLESFHISITLLPRQECLPERCQICVLRRLDYGRKRPSCTEERKRLFDCRNGQINVF